MAVVRAPFDLGGPSLGDVNHGNTDGDVTNTGTDTRVTTLWEEQVKREPRESCLATVIIYLFF